jgi:hypothetical protein
MLNKEVEKTVRNIHDVLKEKETECARLRHEIEALRIVIPLMDEKASIDRTAVIDERKTERASVLNERTEQLEPSMRAAEEREADKAEVATEIDVDRKGPLSASLNETSWWKRQTSR